MIYDILFDIGDSLVLLLALYTLWLVANSVEV